MAEPFIPNDTSVNYQNSFNFLMATDGLEHTEFRVVGISGLGVAIQQLGGINFFGMSANIPGDNLSFSPLQIQVLLDDSFDSLLELYKTFFHNRNPTDNTIDSKVFTGILYMNNNKNWSRIKFTLKNCWIGQIGDLNVSSQTNDSIPLTINVSLIYDFMTVEKVA